MRVVHTAAELKNQASGPSHSVPNLLYALRRQGVEVSLQALEPAPEQQLDFPQTYHGKWVVPSSLGISPSMRRSLDAVAREADVIHTHNLWMMPNIYPGAAARRHGCKLVLTPRGTLTQWAYNYRWWKKQPIWWMLQRRVVFGADLLHVTSEDELEDLRTLGVRAPAALIPNGVDIPPLSNGAASPTERRLLFLGRIHPKKGLDKLLRAWQELCPRHPEWTLEIVGPDNIGYRNEMMELADELDLQRVDFRDPVFGEEKQKVYQRASLFVLPTYSENFGIAVAEALANGVPAVVTKGAPWQGLEVSDSGWWIEDDVGVLAATLDEAMSLPEEERRAMGLRGRQWMTDSFSWMSIGENMKTTYEWLLGRAPRPDWVHLP